MDVVVRLLYFVIGLVVFPAGCKHLGELFIQILVQNYIFLALAADFDVACGIAQGTPIEGVDAALQNRSASLVLVIEALRGHVGSKCWRGLVISSIVRLLLLLRCEQQVLVRIQMILQRR